MMVMMKVTLAMKPGYCIFCFVILFVVSVYNEGNLGKFLASQTRQTKHWRSSVRIKMAERRVRSWCHRTCGIRPSSQVLSQYLRYIFKVALTRTYKEQSTPQHLRIILLLNLSKEDSILRFNKARLLCLISSKCKCRRRVGASEYRKWTEVRILCWFIIFDLSSSNIHNT